MASNDLSSNPLSLQRNAQGVCADWFAPLWQQKAKLDLVEVTLLI